ncbi:MAG: hypothetical protein COB66_08930, partial [Coxiella sp. (in: Bacteria)]
MKTPNLLQITIRWSGIDNNGTLCNNVFFGSKKAFDHFMSVQHIVLITYKIEYKFKQRKKANQLRQQFTSDLANLLQTGLSLVDALTLLSKKHSTTELANLIDDIYQQIKSGKQLSEALASYATYFSQNYIQLICAAEKTNQLPTILAQLSAQQTFMLTISNQLKKAMIYPCATLLFTLFISVGLLIFAIPQFQNIFSSFNATLPLATRAVIAISDVLTKFAIPLLAGALLAPISLVLSYKRSVRVKKSIQHLLTKLPFIKKLYRLKQVASWTNVLAVSTKSGIPLPEGIALANNTLTNLVLNERCQSIVAQLTAGSRLHQAESDTHLFSQDECYLIEIGETSATLPHLLERISQQARDTIQQSLEHLSKWLEPVIMMVLAVVAGGLVIT